MPLAALGVIATIVLSFIPLPNAEFAMEGAAESVTIVLAEAAASDAVVVTRSAVTATSAKLDGSPLGVDANTQVQVEAAAGAPVTASLAIPAHWRLRVRAPPQDALSLTAVRAGANGNGFPTVRFELPAGAILRYVAEDVDQERRLQTPGVLEVSAANLDLRLTPTTTTATLFDRLVPSDLFFKRGEERSDAVTGERLFDAFGSLQSGTLWIGRARHDLKLSLIDSLAVEQIQEGMVRPLALDGSVLRLSARGEAGALTNQPGLKAINLKPSWLDFLVDSGLLKAVAAVATFVIGLEVTRLVRRP